MVHRLRRRLNHIGRDDLLRHGGLLAGSTGLGMVILFVFNILMARSLGPEDFGALGALLGIFAVTSQLSNAVQLTVARSISQSRASANLDMMRSVVMSCARYLMVLALGLFLGFLLLSPVISRFLHLSSALPVILLGLSTSFYLVLPVFRGALQGLQNFRQLVVVRLSESAFLLVAAVILVQVGLGLSGVMVALGLAGLAVLALAALPVRGLVARGVKLMGWRQVVLPGLATLFTVAFISALSNVDLVLVKHFLPGEEAGLYSAVARTGKLVFFVALAFNRAMFPKVSLLYSQGRSPMPLLLRSLLYIGAFSLACMLAAYLLGGPAMRLAYGAEYARVAYILPWYIGAISLLSVSSVMMYYDLSLSSNQHLVPLLAAGALQVVLISLLHKDISQVVLALTLSLAALTLANVAIQVRGARRERRPSVGTLDGATPGPGV